MLRSLCIFSLLALVSGCASTSFKMSESADDTSSGDYGAPSMDTGDMSDSGGGGSETEDPYFKLPPAATASFVFIANPDRDTVTRIQVPELVVDTRAVGEQPTQVQTTGDYQRAVTLNEGSDDISIIDAESFEVRTIGIRDNFNAMSLSEDGRWAACWYNPNADSAAASGGIQTFNEVSLVNLETGEHTPMVVGFNPRSIRWTPDGNTALVISDASLAVIDLTASTLAPALVPLADDALNAPAAEEVEISPDSNWAFVRQFGTDVIVLVDLHALDATTLPVGDNPTDLDLSPDGSEVAVLSRGAHELWLFDAASPFSPPRIVQTPPDTAYGSLLFAGDGSQGVLYTNASALAQYATWDTVTDTITEHALVKPVKAMAVSPTGGSLLVFHTEGDADDADTSSPFYDAWALTLIDLNDYRQNPMVLPAEPSAYSTSTDGKYGFYLMEGYKFLEVLDFETMLPEEIVLNSAPLFVGTLPETDIAFASQEHELGRISFYAAENGSLDTVTGFELNAEIDHRE